MLDVPSATAASWSMHGPGAAIPPNRQSDDLRGPVAVPTTSRSTDPGERPAMSNASRQAPLASSTYLGSSCDQRLGGTSATGQGCESGCIVWTGGPIAEVPRRIARACSVRSPPSGDLTPIPATAIAVTRFGDRAYVAAA